MDLTLLEVIAVVVMFVVVKLVTSKLGIVLVEAMILLVVILVTNKLGIVAVELVLKVPETSNLVDGLVKPIPKLAPVRVITAPPFS